MAFVRTETKSLGSKLGEAFQSVGSSIDWMAQQKMNQAKLDELNQHKDQMAQQMQVERKKGEEVATQQWGDFMVNMAQSKDPEQFLNTNAQRANQLLQYVPGASKMNQEQIIDYAKHLKTNLSDPLGVLARTKAILLDPGSSDTVAHDAYQQADAAISQIKGASPYDTYATWDAKKTVIDDLATKRFSAAMENKKAEIASTFKIGKQQDSQDKMFLKETGDFQTKNAKLFDSLTSEGTGLAELDSMGQNPGVIGLDKVNAIKSAVGGRVTQQEITLADFNPDLVDKLKRAYDKLISGKALPADAVALKQYMETADKAVKDELTKRAVGNAKNSSRIFKKSVPEMTQAYLNKAGIEAPAQSGQGNPPPHGQTVVQGGKTYNWNGSDYVESK